MSAGMFGFFFSHALTFILDIFLVIYGLSCFEGKISFSAVHTTLSFERIVPAEERLYHDCNLSFWSCSLATDQQLVAAGGIRWANETQQLMFS